MKNLLTVLLVTSLSTHVFAQQDEVWDFRYWDNFLTSVDGRQRSPEEVRKAMVLYNSYYDKNGRPIPKKTRKNMLSAYQMSTTTSPIVPNPTPNVLIYPTNNKSIKVDNNYSAAGVMGGVGLMEGIGFHYGVWADLIENGKFGFSFTYGASLSNEDPYDYIYGSADKYTAGGSYKSFGLHMNNAFNTKDVYVGGGVQITNDISTDGFEDNKYSPMLFIGTKKQVYWGVLRGEITISGNMIGLNFGYGWEF